MTATAAQLARRVGLRLKVLDEGENLTTTQEADIVQAIGDLRAFLLERGLCWWDAGTIPDACLDPLTDWAAYMIAPAFGKIRDRQAWLDAKVSLNALRSTAQRPVQAAEYY